VFEGFAVRDPAYDRLHVRSVTALQNEEALFLDRRRHPLQEFKSFWEAGMRYAELTRSDPLFHRKVVEVVHSLTDMVGVGRKGIPANVTRRSRKLCNIISGDACGCRDFIQRFRPGLTAVCREDLLGERIPNLCVANS
jgi:hypothetical protein